ncbi:MAG: hypothetical protein CMM48_00620 [Rhodospirillaceae bacterium]|nr:hypothetical protein [Rhodospirillaceae bacterium]HAA92831.1 DUF3833 domain-containing protein [Rhodospirillaceae bacterium]
MKIEDFRNKTPKFVFEDYFSGETRAWGIVSDRFGNIRRQFSVDMNGHWDGNILTLNEKFSYDDGEIDLREWKVHKFNANTYEGTASDVVGKAVGTSFGNALNWRYTLALEIGGRVWNISFDDWMILQNDGVLFNRAEMRKFGIKIGEISLFFRKHETGIDGRGDQSYVAAAE